MLSTWETFARKRYEKGREEGREEREALAKRVSELEKQIKDVRNSNGSSRR